MNLPIELIEQPESVTDPAELTPEEAAALEAAGQIRLSHVDDELIHFENVEQKEKA